MSLYPPSGMGPAPFYQDDSVALYHGEARDILPTLPPGSVDLLLTDPPFFMPADHHAVRSKWQRAWSDTSILAAFWGATLDLAIPKMKRSSHVLTFCDGASYPVFYPETYRRFDSLVCLVWDKQAIGMGRVWRRRHELILAARWESAEFAESGGSRADVLQAKVTPSSDRLHPVEKPDALLRQLIEPTTKAGDMVLDPFAGSGSTLTAAKALGRRAIGIEAEERYCQVIAERCAQEVLDFGEAAA